MRGEDHRNSGYDNEERRKLDGEGSSETQIRGIIAVRKSLFPLCLFLKLIFILFSEEMLIEIFELNKRRYRNEIEK